MAQLQFVAIPRYETPQGKLSIVVTQSVNALADACEKQEMKLEGKSYYGAAATK